MHEHFMIELKAHDLTKRIFNECVHMMKHIQANFLDESTYTDAGAWSAAQVLVTVNFNYVLEAMPALPVDYSKRHHLRLP